LKIRVVTPIITESFGPLILREFKAAARQDDEISNVFLDRGPASLESAYDDALAVPDTVAKVHEAEREGADAVIINCMADPGLKAAREVVSIGAATRAMYDTLFWEEGFPPKLNLTLLD